MAMFELQTAPTLPTVGFVMAGFHRARDTKRFPISSMLARKFNSCQIGEWKISLRSCGSRVRRWGDFEPSVISHHNKFFFRGKCFPTYSRIYEVIANIYLLHWLTSWFIEDPKLRFYLFDVLRRKSGEWLLFRALASFNFSSSRRGTTPICFPQASPA